MPCKPFLRRLIRHLLPDVVQIKVKRQFRRRANLPGSTRQRLFQPLGKFLCFWIDSHPEVLLAAHEI